MKKLFTLAAAVLASFSLWAATETHPSGATKDTDVNGVSYTIPGIYIAGEGGTKAGEMQTKGVKFRLGNKVDKTNKGFYFKVNEGYKITEVVFCGHVNDNSKTSTLKSVMVDGVSINYAPVDLPNKSTSKTITVSGFEALDSVVFVFEGEGTQANLEYTVTYEEATTKTVVSTVETLTAVTINDYPLAAADFTTLTTAHTLILEDSAYVTAPVVKFTKHTVITYDDETTKEKDEVIEKISQQAQASMWGATVDIAGIAYTVYTIKPLSYTVTYKEGEQVLGTEVVAANSNPKEYAQYESLPLSTFEGWYKDAELTQAVVSMAAEVISADATFYAKFSKAYAQSIDFEQMVLNQGKSYDVKSALTAKFYDYKTIDALDSLNNEKGAGRNEPYLGLKIKKKGGYLACNVQAGTTIRIKFGYVAETVLAIAGTDTMTLTPTNNKIAELEFQIMVETLVKLQTTSDKTVVIKQIMVDEPLVTWMYPITYAPAENGKVEGWAIAFPDETVTLTVTPNEGYKVASVTAGNEVVVPVEDVYSFVMPGQEVTVSATFASDGTAIDNTEANVKAVKVVRNGQLFIEKNGVLFNAQGAVVR